MTTFSKLPNNFCANAGVAYTLPARYYTAPDIFAVEKERIFADQWICVSHGSEVAENNSYITRELIGENIIIVRGQDGVLRAFYNVCPHRGHQLLNGNGTIRNSITCPYHAWVFKLNGELLRARNCENVEAFDAQSASLVALKVEEYAGFIFINMNANATVTVAEQLPQLAEKMLAACPVIHQLTLAARFESCTPANWKVIVDNYLECYHCAPAHPGFSDSVDVSQYAHTLHGNWTLQFGVAKPSDKSFKSTITSDNANFSGFWAWPCTMFNMPPADNCMTAIFEFPINEKTTLQYYDIYFLNEELTQDQLELINWYKTVFRPEDLRLVESVQKGLTSRGYRGQGRIMTDRTRSGISEHGIAHFHHLLAQQY